jgi:ABC-type transporter Mla subunit MlaD
MAEVTIRISDKALKITGIVLGALCLVWVVTHLWSSGLLHPKYRLRVYVSQAAGLASGAPVRVDGLDVGTVESINFADTSSQPERKFELVLKIEKRYENEIRSDSTITLITQGLFGERYVSIDRGFSGNSIPPGGEIRAMQTQEASLKDIRNLLTSIVCPDREEPDTKGKPPSRQ